MVTENSSKEKASDGLDLSGMDLSVKWDVGGDDSYLFGKKERLKIASLNGAKVDYVDLRYADLGNALINTIRVGNGDKEREVNLEEYSVVLSDDMPSIVHSDELDAATCFKSDTYFESVMGGGQAFAIRNALAVFGKSGGKNVVLGFIKSQGSKTFLPLRTVYSADGRPVFRKGLICRFLDRKSLRPLLERAGFSGKLNHIWRGADLQNISTLLPDSAIPVRHFRFISYPEIYDFMTQTIKELESPSTQIIDIFEDDKQ